MKLSQNAICLFCEFWDMSHETILLERPPGNSVCWTKQWKMVEPGLEYKGKPLQLHYKHVSLRQTASLQDPFSVASCVEEAGSVGWTWRRPSGLSQLGLHKGIHECVLVCVINDGWSVLWEQVRAFMPSEVNNRSRQIHCRL